MPAADTVLLPLCVGLALIGVIITGLAWRRGNRGRVVQGVGLALAPVALYFTGLLGLLWRGIVAIGKWAGGIVFSPTIWFGFSLLGLCLVLWVVGGLVARRFPGKSRTAKGTKAGATKAGTTPAKTAALPAKGAQSRNQPPVDDDMAEIEALLKSRGID